MKKNFVIFSPLLLSFLIFLTPTKIWSMDGHLVFEEKKQICKYFNGLSNSCRYGNNCKFFHNITNPETGIDQKKLEEKRKILIEQINEIKEQIQIMIEEELYLSQKHKDIYIYKTASDRKTSEGDKQKSQLQREIGTNLIHEKQKEIKELRKRLRELG